MDDEQEDVLPVGSIPFALGRGILSTTNQQKALLCSIDDAEKNTVLSSDIKVALASSRSEYARAVSWSVNAKMGFSGGSASVRASSSREFKSSQRRFSLILSKYVTSNEYFIRDPAIREEALSLYSENPSEFYRRLGDKFINRVVTGGVLSIVYNFSFKTREQSSAFKASASFSYGGGEGSASFHEKVSRAASNSQMNIVAFNSGGKNAPPIFGAAAGATVNPNDPGALSEIFTYFDNYEEDIHSSQSVFPVFLGTKESSEILNAPVSMQEFYPRRKVMDRVIELDDQIDQRRSELEYFINVSHVWNLDDGALSKALEYRNELIDKSKDLEEFADAVANIRTNELTVPFNASDLPKLHKNWLLRPLKKGGEILFKGHGPKDPNVTYKLKLGRYSDGQAMKVEIGSSLGFPQDKTVKFEAQIVFLDKNDKALEVVHSESHDNANTLQRSEFQGYWQGSFQPIQRIVAVPTGAVSLLLTVKKSRNVYFPRHQSLYPMYMRIFK